MDFVKRFCLLQSICYTLWMFSICGKFNKPQHILLSLYSYLENVRGVCKFSFCRINYAVSSELQLFSTDNPGRLFDRPDNVIRVGNALDVAVELSCRSTAGNSAVGLSAVIQWVFADNGTVVPIGLTAFGTSQGEGGVLRVYPANTLSRTGTRMQCRDVENNQTLNVTLELRKPDNNNNIN